MFALTFHHGSARPGDSQADDVADVAVAGAPVERDGQVRLPLPRVSVDGLTAATMRVWLPEG
ncbi:hypothetical protein ACQ143_14345 [Microbacterium sp. MC2]